MHQLAGPPDLPTAIILDEITAVSVVIQWQPGLDGGYPQTFHVLHHIMDSKFNNQHGVSIPGASDGAVVRHKLTGLEPSTQYQFKIRVANTMFSVVSAVVEATTLGNWYLHILA